MFEPFHPSEAKASYQQGPLMESTMESMSDHAFAFAAGEHT